MRTLNDWERFPVGYFLMLSDFLETEGRKGKSPAWVYEIKASKNASSDHPLNFLINGVYGNVSPHSPIWYTKMHFRIKSWQNKMPN